MSEQDKERYQILLPVELLPTGFDGLLLILDKAIQDFFCLIHRSLVDFRNEELLPDTNLDVAIQITRSLLHHIFNQGMKEGYSVDTLRAALIKFASINRAINDIDAIINIQNEDTLSLPENIEYLWHIKTESEILSSILDIFNENPDNLPPDLIECSILLCKMYIITSMPCDKTEEVLEEFNSAHMQPRYIAVSAALLYHDYLKNRELNLKIRGDTNKYINVYNTLSKFSKKIHSTDTLKIETLWNHGFPEELFKYLTTRYSVSVFGLSPFYPSQIGARAHLKVRKKKLELQREAYELLKDMSVNDAHRLIKMLYCCVNDLISQCESQYEAGTNKAKNIPVVLSREEIDEIFYLLDIA